LNTVFTTSSIGEMCKTVKILTNSPN